jgi:hypothetical protein
LSIYKRLEFTYLNTAGPFPQRIGGNTYLILNIDSYTRVICIILLKYKSDVILLMKTWEAEVVVATGEMIIARRIDNEPKLVEAVHEWRSATRSEVTLK